MPQFLEIYVKNIKIGLEKNNDRVYSAFLQVRHLKSHKTISFIQLLIYLLLNVSFIIITF